MNRLILTKLLKDIIDLYMDDKFTYIYIIDILSKIETLEYDEDKNAYMQAELIKTLFELFPYYRLLNDLTDLGDYIIESTKANPNFKYIAKILKNGCLGDMVPDIKRRVQTETMAHINELIYIHSHEELTPDKVLKSLTRNMFDPQILTGMDTAESINYEQTSLPEFIEKTSSLRDIISRTNGNRKENIRRNLEEYTIANYDESSLEDFIKQVLDIIDGSSLSDKKLLRDTIDESLTALYAKSVITWEEQKELAQKKVLEDAIRAKRGDNYQLSLTFD